MSNGGPFFETGPTCATAQHDNGPIQDEQDRAWFGMLHQLVLYQIQNGHCFVPRKDRRHPHLAAWLEKQVMLFQKGRLSKEKQRELEALGMVWDYDDDGATSRNDTAARWETGSW